jgi:ABC-type multidrug transport system fused ATPase/permease subunit
LDGFSRSSHAVANGADEANPPPHGVWQALRAIHALMSRPRRRQLYVTLLLMVLGAVAELVTIGAALPFLALISDPQRATEIGAVAFIFDLFGWRQGDRLILPATLLLAAAALFAGAVRLLLNWATQAFVFRFGHDMSVAIFARVLRQPYLYHVERNTSEAIAGVEKVQAAIFAVLLPVMQGVVAAFMATFVIALLIAIDPVTALSAAAAMSALYVGLSLATRRMLRDNSRIVGEAHTLRVKQVQEGLGGIRDILIDRSQPVFEEAFREVDDRLRKAQLVNNFVAQAPRLVVEAGGIVLIALLALYMSYQPGGIVAAIPILGALAIGAQRLLPMLQAVYLAWSRTAGSLQVLFDIAGLVGSPLPDAGLRGEVAPSRRLRRDIEFDRVSFRYPGGRRPALHEVTLTIARGERIGLIGETGSGKSTLLDVLMGLLPPTGGEIRIDGRPLDQASRSDWQGQIAHVPQFIYLADSSIAANIAFGAPSEAIDLERVRAAAARAQIAAFIEGLPGGYETTVGERGVRLSGGQRQRIGIARALYKGASVLILDEATSALDDSTEAAVIEALGHGEYGLTLLMVAHRLTTLAACDRLVRLERGRIAQVGSYEELVGGAAAARRRRGVSSG